MYLFAFSFVILLRYYCKVKDQFGCLLGAQFEIVWCQTINNNVEMHLQCKVRRAAGNRLLRLCIGIVRQFMSWTNIILFTLLAPLWLELELVIYA